MKKLFRVEDCETLTNDDVRALYRKHVNPALENIFSSFSIGSELIDHAEGVWIYTKSGKQILDATGGVGVLNHGHNHPRILKVRKAYLEEKRMEVHKTIFSPYLAVLSHNLAAVLPEGMDYSFFCNSGAEAIEGAMKLAYKYHGGGRKFILHSNISYHGKLLGSGSIMGSKEVDFNFPKIPNTASFEYNSVESVKQLINKLRNTDGSSQIYALFVEPYSASTFRNCDEFFLKEIRRICNEEKIILVFDEIFSGWCKTNNLFYFMNYDIIPDILTTSKSLGGGKASISAYVVRKEILKTAYGNVNDAVLHSTTYNGFGEECVTAIEAINIMVEENYVDKSRKAEKIIERRINSLVDNFPELVAGYRGVGTMFCILLKTKTTLLDSVVKVMPLRIVQQPNFISKLITASFTDWLFVHHQIYAMFTDDGIVFSPPVIIEEKEIDVFFNAFEETMKAGFLKIVMHFVANKLSNILRPDILAK